MHYLILILTLLIQFLDAGEVIYLKENLNRARPGDFIVTAQGKNYTLLNVISNDSRFLTLEETTIPSTWAERYVTPSWKEWVQQGALGNTSWVIYQIDLNTGKMGAYYSYTKGSWCQITEADGFLSTLLNLQLQKVPLQSRKKVGHVPASGTDRRRLWQPRMVVEGQLVENVPFEAYTTKWPQDGGELSGRTIEVYVPADFSSYPSYFPYWLQISGYMGQAKIRIVDSGSQLRSPQNGFPPL